MILVKKPLSCLPLSAFPRHAGFPSATFVNVLPKGLFARFNFRFPQCVSLRSGLNARASLRWIARSVAMRAKNIQAMSRFSTAWVSISAAARTFGKLSSGLGTVLAR
jgi:hypothetical protein